MFSVPSAHAMVKPTSAKGRAKRVCEKRTMCSQSPMVAMDPCLLRGAVLLSFCANVLLLLSLL